MLFLLTWNPNKFLWIDYPFLCEESVPLYLNWSTCSRRMRAGDEFCLLMQGMGDQNGIVGYGKFVARAGNRMWSDDPSAPLLFLPYGSRSFLVDTRFDALCNYRDGVYPHTDFLQYLFPGQCWRPQSSGIRIKEEYETRLRQEILNTLLAPKDSLVNPALWE